MGKNDDNDNDRQQKSKQVSSSQTATVTYLLLLPISMMRDTIQRNEIAINNSFDVLLEMIFI